MPNHLLTDSPIEPAWNAALEQLAALELEWKGERAAIEWATRDLIHHVCHALCVDDEFDHADDGDRVLAHEAYLSAITMAELLARAVEDSLAPPVMLDRAIAAVAALLDAMTPYVSRADAGLRATCLDGESIEDVLARIGEQH